MGPYIALYLSAGKNTAPFSNVPPVTVKNTPPLDEIATNVLYGLAIGAGVDINKLSFGIRFSQSITKVFETKEARNTAISITAAYHF